MKKWKIQKKMKKIKIFRMEENIMEENNNEKNSDKKKFDEKFKEQVESVKKLFDAYNKSKEESEEER